MTMHSDNKGHGLGNSLSGQLGMLVAAAVILVLIAWLFIW